MYYLNLDEDGYVLSVSETDTGGPCVESLDGLDFAGYRINAYRWDGENVILDMDKLAVLEVEQQERQQAEHKPSEQEQLRADVDFLLIMGGYI